MTGPARSNLAGGAWLLADMALNIWALSIIKALGLGYGPAQLVFLRASVGVVVLSPWIWLGRRHFANLTNIPTHLARVAFSAIALSSSFYAITRVPLAFFSAVGFTRPLVTMVLAALVLNELIGPRRWLAAALAMTGIAVAVNPREMVGGTGLIALLVMVLASAGAVILTRRLRDAPKIVLMSFYAVGLTLLTAPIALTTWIPIAPAHMAPLLAVGLFASLAQLLYLRAHQMGDAGFLSVLSYLSLIFSVSVGFLVFGETPDWSFFAGAALVMTAALWVAIRERRAGRPATSAGNRL